MRFILFSGDASRVISAVVSLVGALRMDKMGPRGLAPWAGAVARLSRRDHLVMATRGAMRINL